MSNLGFFTVNAILRDCRYRKKNLVLHGKMDKYLQYSPE
jgi:hypothetical protein